MALCTQADVQTRLQITFTVNPEPVIAALIAAAEGHIRRVYGGPVEAADYTEEHNGHRGVLFLRHIPVNSVASVTEDGGAALVEDTDFVWYSNGRLERIRGGYPIGWRTLKRNAIEVQYNAGFVTVPGDIVDVCAWMVANAVRRGLAFAENEGILSAGVASENVGDYAIAYFASIADPASLVLMIPEQRNVIESYRIPVTA